MPRTARFRIAAIAELARQLEYAPDATRRRQMDAAEVLVHDLDPHQNYPRDFIIFRITGYRPDEQEGPVTFVGQALLPDLVNLVQTLSSKLELFPDELQRTPIAVDDLPSRLNVSFKTIQRYRKQGLICHFARVADGEKRLVCFEDALVRFEAGRAGQLRRAAGFSRINGAQERAIIEQARSMREQGRLTLNQAAFELAQQHGRAHETIRMMLRRHDRKADDPIFGERGPLTEREIKVIHRAWRRGVKFTEIAQRFNKSKPTIHRAINRRRADLLRTISFKHIHLPTFDLPEADAVILAAPAVTSNLNLPPGQCDALQFIDSMLKQSTTDESAEHALVAAYNYLKMRSAKALVALNELPSSEELDAIETDLRWAAMLKRKLMMMSFPTALRRIEQFLHRPLKSQTAEQIVSLLAQAVEVISTAVEAVDPGREQRLDRLVSYAMDRALARHDQAKGQARAAARHQAGSINVPNLFVGIPSWGTIVDPPESWLAHTKSLPEDLRRLISMRYALSEWGGEWGGGPPLTCDAIASRLTCKNITVVRRLQRAIRLLRQESRAG